MQFENLIQKCRFPAFPPCNGHEACHVAMAFLFGDKFKSRIRNMIYKRYFLFVISHDIKSIGYMSSLKCSCNASIVE